MEPDKIESYQTKVELNGNNNNWRIGEIINARFHNYIEKSRMGLCSIVIKSGSYAKYSPINIFIFLKRNILMIISLSDP